MRHLLDAHALIFALDDPNKLGKRAVAVLEDPDSQLLISVGTIWELAIKTGLGKLSLSLPYRQWLERAMADPDLKEAAPNKTSPVGSEGAFVQCERRWVVGPRA
jgi:PIN domain nuclease of toxin-antitoxin system